MDPKLPGLVGFTSNYWSSKGSTCYYWASLCRMWSHCGLSWRASALLRQLQGCGKRDTDNIHLRSHPLTSDFSFPLIHSLKIGHLLRKIFDTSAFTSRSPRMKSVWESVPSLQHGSVFCFVFKGCLFPGEKHPFLPGRQQADACKHKTHSRFRLSSLLFPQFSE